MVTEGTNENTSTTCGIVRPGATLSFIRVSLYFRRVGRANSCGRCAIEEKEENQEEEAEDFEGPPRQT
jgi:hypothetical protein